MVYTIIGQNNSVTTIDDGNGHTLHVPSRVALAIGTTFTIVEVNNNMATLEDSNGKVYRDIPCVVDLVGSGGGGAVDSVNGKTGVVVLDAKDVKAIPQVSTMSTPTEEMIVQYVGATDATYTNGYFYKSTGTTTYTDSTTFDPASISGTTVTATAGALAGLCAEYGSGNITDIIKGTLTYDQSSDLLVFVGLDDTDTQVCTFQLYTQDYTDAGFTFTGTLADGDVINFTTTISEGSTTYTWERINVQPAPEILPDQTGHSGEFLTTDGTDASWSDKPLVNNATGTRSIAIGNNSSATYIYSTALGTGANCSGNFTVSVGDSSTASSGGSIAIGYAAKATASYAIQLNSSVAAATNSDANTFKVANHNGNFEIMSADGTIPTDRYTTTPSADGTYVPTLTISSGVATRTWAAPSGGSPTTTTVTLAVNDWSNNSQTVTVNGVTGTSVVWVAPEPSDTADYVAAGILCTSQATNSLTFTATTTPTTDIDVNIVYL